MRDTFTENKSLALLLGILAFISLGALYYYVILPKNEARDQLASSVTQLQQESVALEQQIADLEKIETSAADDFELRKKLPAKRELEQLLRSLNEVELISESKIVGVTFNNYDDEVAKSTIVPPAEEENTEENALTEEENPEEQDEIADEQPENTEEQPENAEEEKPVTFIDITTMPPELKLMTLNVELITLDEEHLLTFLQELESLERVVRIDAVDIAQPGEEQLALKNPDKRISVSIQLTTFYAEEAM